MDNGLVIPLHLWPILVVHNLIFITHNRSKNLKKNKKVKYLFFDFLFKKRKNRKTYVSK